MKIFLWGMPGAGKSTVGRELAEFLLEPFSDLDQLIQTQTGRSPAEWIAQDGEPAFRIQEHRMLLQWTPNQGVLACGGGTPCFYNQYEWMNQQGITFWLNPSLDIIQNNLAQSKDDRPLLQTSQKKNLQDLLKQREHHYAQAQLTLKWEDQASPKDLVQRMLIQLQYAGLWRPSR
jgi:shikimate kinase